MRAARRCWAGYQSFSFRYRFSLKANWFFLPVRHQRGVKLFRISRLLKLCSYFSFYTQYIIWKFRVVWMWICDYRTKGGHLKDIHLYVQSTVQGFNEKPFKTSEKPCVVVLVHTLLILRHRILTLPLAPPWGQDWWGRLTLQHGQPWMCNIDSEECKQIKWLHVNDTKVVKT